MWIKIEEYYIETEKIKRIFKTDNSMIISYRILQNIQNIVKEERMFHII